MSIEGLLTLADYHTIMNWYELAFGKHDPNKIDQKDHSTFRKLSVMAQSYMEEQKKLSSNNDDDKA